MSRTLARAILAVGLAGCTRTTEPAVVQPPATREPSVAQPPAGAPVASAPAAGDAWAATCAGFATCGACLNAPPCNWCAGAGRCVGPQTQCAELRVSDGSACYTAPLRVAEKRHPELAQRIASYEMARETKTLALSGFRQERFLLNAGDCFAVLSEGAKLGLHYAIQQRGSPDPARKNPMPEPGTGAPGARAELSPEFCPWEPVYLVVTWLTPSPQAPGDIRLHLLRRSHPDPARLAREAAAATPPSARAPARGGNCSDYECGEDCRSELRACNHDCFRYGRHEMGSDRMCKAGCLQAARSCERSCRIPCPR